MLICLEKKITTLIQNAQYVEKHRGNDFLIFEDTKKLTKLYKDFGRSNFDLFNYKTYLIFLFASLAVSIGLQMILPFPYGLGAALAIFIAFPLLLRRRYMNRMKGYGDYGSGGGGGFFGMNQGGGAVKYVCLACNHRYKGGSCPRCGSKMKRADF